MKDRYSIEKLDPRKHERKGFDCGLEILNLYLQTRANQEQEKRLNVVYVAYEASDSAVKKNIVGYYSLSNSAIALHSLDIKLKRGIPPTYDIPTVKLGRLAVDRHHQGKGLGTCLLKNALQRIIELSALSGIRGVEVIAKNGAVAAFYETFGFMELGDSPGIYFLPLDTLLK